MMMYQYVQLVFGAPSMNFEFIDEGFCADQYKTPL
jgi:hypothetical protein